MAVAFDAASSASTEANDPSWTHTPVGTPRGVVVFTLQHGPANSITGVTYGGVPVPFAFEALGVSSPDASAAVFFLGEGLPSGVQTVVVTTSGGSSTHAAAFTVTADENVVLSDVDGDWGSIGAVAAWPIPNLALGAENNFVAAAMLLVGVNDLTAATGWSVTDEEADTNGFGTPCVFAYARRNSLATGTFSGPGPFSFAGSQNAVFVAVGLREAAAIPVGFDVELIWNTHVTLPDPDLTRTELQADAETAIRAAGTQIIHQVDIYENDGTTLWRRDAAFVDYTVNVDAASQVRRTLDLVLYDDDDLAPRPGGFWYDKLIKVHRGVHIDTRTFTITGEGAGNMIVLAGTNTISLTGANSIEVTGGTTTTVDGYEADFLEPVGVFAIDRIDLDSFPRPLIVVAGSDLMAGLNRAKFGAPTTFPAGAQVEHVAAQIAEHGNVTRLRLHGTDLSLGRDFTFEADTTCAAALDDLAAAFGCEAFFDRHGYLVFRPLDDPDTAAPTRTYQPGENGDIARVHWQASRERIYNDVVVSGESSDPDVAPVFARAENTNPASPTRIRTGTAPGGLPRTTYRYVSAFLTTEEQCEQTALRTLQRVALEDVEATADVLCYPWLDENRVVRIVDDNPAPGQPAAQRFLLRSFPISSKPGTHAIRGRRVVNVG